ncbi:hypothetical protein GCM10010341_05750 [Streptomyces noursei]|nr:hypothetical protein GCM10010341_05750 [Streptomyces noursei]
MRPAAAGPIADAIGPRVLAPRYVTASVAAPILRSSERAPGVRAHQTSWPCVVATILATPASRRSRAAISPSGAAAPNHTLSHAYRWARAAARDVMRGVGSIIGAGSRITGKGSAASWAGAPGSDDVETTTASCGKRVAMAWTKVSIPPWRGGKSLVTISVGLMEPSPL